MLVFTLLAVAIVATAPPLTSFSTTEIRWEPQQPAQGTIVQFRVRPERAERAAESVMIVHGTLAGQQMHFEVNADGSFTAIGGIPITAPERLPLHLTLDYQNGDRQVLRINVPVARVRFPTERLRVAPRYSTRPNAALARRIARERARSRAAWQHSHSTPRLWEAPFLRPRPTRITSGFGLGRVFNGQVRSRHMGTDFDGDTGDPVLASNRGVVRLVGNFYYGGRLVYLDHGRGLLTAYLHLSQVDVSEGDIVERGQVIGKVGATGRVTGPHLHWIARYGAVTANPLSLLEIGRQDIPPVAASAPQDP